MEACKSEQSVLVAQSGSFPTLSASAAPLNPGFQECIADPPGAVAVATGGSSAGVVCETVMLRVTGTCGVRETSLQPSKVARATLYLGESLF